MLYNWCCLNPHCLLATLQEFPPGEDQWNVYKLVFQIICMLRGIFSLCLVLYLMLWLRIINSHLRDPGSLVRWEMQSSLGGQDGKSPGLSSWLIWYTCNICPVARIVASALPLALFIHSSGLLAEVGIFSLFSISFRVPNASLQKSLFLQWLLLYSFFYIPNT